MKMKGGKVGGEREGGGTEEGEGEGRGRREGRRKQYTIQHQVKLTTFSFNSNWNVHVVHCMIQ